MSNLFENVIYLQIRRRWLGVQYLGWSGRQGEWVGVPEVTFVVNHKGRVHAVDHDHVEASGGNRFVAFSHPRTLLHDFDNTKIALIHLIKKSGARPGLGRPTFVVQVAEEVEGGLTDIELRALIEMCKGVGAGRVLPVAAPRPLSPPEILQLVRGRRTDTAPVPTQIA